MKTIKLEGDTAETRNAFLRSILQTGIYSVTFTKLNGELRTMPCTLKADLLPPLIVNEDKPAKVPKADTMGVWCTDKQEWRAFKVMNVIDVQEPNEVLDYSI
jgi:hypothetical protein